MSHSSFTNDLNDEIAALNSDPSAPARIDFQTAHRRVFGRWLAQGRHEGLVKYLVTNLDGAEGGEEWMRLLAEALAAKDRPDLIRKLYRPVISLRRNHYFWRRAHLKMRWPLPRFLDTVLNHASGKRRRLAKYKLSVLALMQDQRRVMATVRESDLSAIDREIAAFTRGDALPQQFVPVAKQIMDEKVFWMLVADARATGASESEIAPILEASLGGLQPQEIERFDKILRELLDRAYRWDLWAIAYAVRGGCGDDEFDYFRQWLVLQGRDVYEAAVGDPVAWAVDFEFDGDAQCESLLSVARDAYRAKTGREMPPRKGKRATTPAGEAWTEENLAARFPALASHFNLNR